MRRRLLGCFLLTVVGLVVSPAHAVTVYFDNITNNSPIADSIAGQFTVDVTDVGGTQVLFEFANLGPTASSITQAYFDDIDSAPLLSTLTFDPANTSSGVNFHSPTPPGPPDLPAGNTVSFAADFSAGAESQPGGVPVNGVNPGETLGILFSYQGSNSFSDVMTALIAGTLRIGIHVQSIPFAEGDFSESFVNVPVPVPATLPLLGSAVAGLAGFRIRRTS